jgi:Protein of unknown function (DUF3237)
MAALQHEMTYRIRVRGPMKTTAGSPLGERAYWEMSAGELSGPRIKARLAMAGDDWFRLGADGFGRPDVRVAFVTDDGESVLLHYQGLVQLTDAFKRAAENDAATRFEDQYMRMAMFFDTGAASYAWLTQNLFVAEGRLSGPKEVEYRIYRVT